jgi:hypothetical protein
VNTFFSFGNLALNCFFFIVPSKKQVLFYLVKSRSYPQKTKPVEAKVFSFESFATFILSNLKSTSRWTSLDFFRVRFTLVSTQTPDPGRIVIIHENKTLVFMKEP